MYLCHRLPNLSAMTRKFAAAVIAAIVMTFSAATASAVEKGEKSMGVRAGYTTSNHSGVAGLYFSYAFSSRFRLAPDVDYSFRHNGTDAFSININAHVPVTVPQSRFTVYPLAGLNYTSWNLRERSTGDYDDVSTRTDRLGINIGAGADLAVTPTLRLGFESKLRWIRNYNSGVFTVSIGYVF